MAPFIMQPCQPTASDYSRSYGSYTSKIEVVDNYNDDDDTVKTLWFKNDDGWTDDGHGSAPNINSSSKSSKNSDLVYGSSKSSKNSGLAGLSSKSSKDGSGITGKAFKSIGAFNGSKSKSTSKGASINVGGGGKSGKGPSAVGPGKSKSKGTTPINPINPGSGWNDDGYTPPAIITSNPTNKPTDANIRGKWSDDGYPPAIETSMPTNKPTKETTRGKWSDDGYPPAVETSKPSQKPTSQPIAAIVTPVPSPSPTACEERMIWHPNTEYTMCTNDSNYPEEDSPEMAAMYLYESLEECCKAVFGTAVCEFDDICSTSSPTSSPIESVPIVTKKPTMNVSIRYDPVFFYPLLCCSHLMSSLFAIFYSQLLLPVCLHCLLWLHRHLLRHLRHAKRGCFGTLILDSSCVPTTVTIPQIGYQRQCLISTFTCLWKSAVWQSSEPPLANTKTYASQMYLPSLRS